MLLVTVLIAFVSILRVWQYSGYISTNYQLARIDKPLLWYILFSDFRLRNFLSCKTMATNGGLEHEQLYKDVMELVREYLIKYKKRSSKVRC